MPKFTITKSWINVIGPIWMPPITCAMEYVLDNHQIHSIEEQAKCDYPNNDLPLNKKVIRSTVEKWLSINSGDFQHIEDFEAFITLSDDSEIEICWEDENSEFIFNGCMMEEE